MPSASLAPPHLAPAALPTYLPTSQGLERGSIIKGLLSRISGANGFQLVNVTNTPIQLEHIEFENRLVNRVREMGGRGG